MTATTPGELFPELRNIAPLRERKCIPPRKFPGKSVSKITRQGTADRLKALYPEMMSWSPVLVTQAWFKWLSENQMELVEPEIRDERFPEYLVELMVSYTQEEKAEAAPRLSRNTRLFSV
ncbi:hypothetical protein C5855_10325 [Salmonella enterica]|nr:hypothetical protein [Salmonella enterica]ECC5733363.1 hypothetical protein [Salmonella enterica]ECE2501713.1 hypothetical protein [Salmonella enterica]